MPKRPAFIDHAQVRLLYQGQPIVNSGFFHLKFIIVYYHTRYSNENRESKCGFC